MNYATLATPSEIVQILYDECKVNSAELDYIDVTADLELLDHIGFAAASAAALKISQQKLAELILAIAASNTALGKKLGAIVIRNNKFMAKHEKFNFAELVDDNIELADDAEASDDTRRGELFGNQEDFTVNEEIKEDD